MALSKRCCRCASCATPKCSQCSNGITCLIHDCLSKLESVLLESAHISPIFKRLLRQHLRESLLGEGINFCSKEKEKQVIIREHHALFMPCKCWRRWLSRYVTSMLAPTQTNCCTTTEHGGRRPLRDLPVPHDRTTEHYCSSDCPKTRHQTQRRRRYRHLRDIAPRYNSHPRRSAQSGELTWIVECVSK